MYSNRLVEKSPLYFMIGRMSSSIVALWFHDRRPWSHCEGMSSHECSYYTCCKHCSRVAAVMMPTVNHLVTTMNSMCFEKMMSIAWTNPRISLVQFYTSLVHSVEMPHHACWWFPISESPTSKLWKMKYTYFNNYIHTFSVNDSIWNMSVTPALLNAFLQCLISIWSSHLYKKVTHSQCGTTYRNKLNWYDVVNHVIPNFCKLEL